MRISDVVAVRLVYSRISNAAPKNTPRDALEVVTSLNNNRGVGA